ncbi:o-succinylbenzoate--CoA ligase [Calditrichota bacterium GD2]
MIGCDWIGRWAFYAPDKTALKEYESGRTLTYRKLNALANHAAHFLKKDYGITRGDRLAVLAENCLEYFILFSAAQKAGFILVPLNYRLAPAELDFMLQDAMPLLTISEKKFTEKVSRSAQNVLLLEELQEMLWSKAEIKAEPFPQAPIKADDPLFILYTSGTTGTPKGALYTHKMLFWNAVNTEMRLDITSADRSVSCTPLFHTGGWNVIPTPFLHRGAYFCLMKTFEPAVVNQLLQEEKATMFMGVPTMLRLMADAENFERTDFSSLRFFVIGGEPMPLPLIDRWHNKGVPVRQGYGLTECGPSITSLHQDDAIRKRGSIGTLNFYIEKRIIDEAGNDVPPGNVGELLLKGPVITPGYWQNPEATKKAFTNGWFHTGDLVKQDAEGYLYIVDRKKNMYISGGENVYPAEVEKVLYQHPAVSEAAIIGVPDKKWGEVGMAFVVLKEKANVTDQELIAFCQERLARFKIPKYFKFIKEIPKSDTGKIDRKALERLTQFKEDYP